MGVKEMEIKKENYYYDINEVLIRDADSLIRFINIPYIIHLEGICFSKTNYLYLILEKMDGDLYELSLKLSFDQRLEQLDNLINILIQVVAI